MCAYRIEITQGNGIQFGGFAAVSKNDFTRLFGISVRRFCGFYGFLFCNWQAVCLSVYRTRGAEYKIVNFSDSQFLQEIDQGIKVVLIITQGTAYTFPNSLESRKMDDTVNGVVVKKIPHSLLISQIDVCKGGCDSGNGNDAVQNRNRRIGQIVDDHNFVPFILQFHYGVRSDKTETSSYQYLFHSDCFLIHKF